MHKKSSCSSESLAKQGLRAPPFPWGAGTETVNGSLSVTNNCTNYLCIYFFLDASTWFSTSEKVAKNQACLKMGLKICITGCNRQGNALLPWRFSSDLSGRLLRRLLTALHSDFLNAHFQKGVCVIYFKVVAL